MSKINYVHPEDITNIVTINGQTSVTFNCEGAKEGEEMIFDVAATDMINKSIDKEFISRN